MLKQIRRDEELRIPSIALSTKETKEDLIVEAKYKLVFARQLRTLRFSAKNCVTLIVVDECHTV